MSVKQNVAKGNAVKRRIFRSGRVAIAAAAASIGLLFSGPVLSQTAPPASGNVEWGMWVDDDGCMHWWADGGAEGYMLDRVNPENGRPVCLKKNTCMVENADTLFATDSARLRPGARQRLADFFTRSDAFGYAIYGHTDSRASDEYNIRLSQRRAASVAEVARSVGAVVQRQIGFGERRPVATNRTAAGMQKNRRVEVVCYRW